MTWDIGNKPSCSGILEEKHTGNGNWDWAGGGKDKPTSV
jgi:hypothetical protein